MPTSSAVSGWRAETWRNSGATSARTWSGSLEAAASAVTRNRLLDAVLERHPVEVPESMVAEELARAGLGGPAEAPLDPAHEAAEAGVRRRLQQGLVLARIVSDHQLTADPGAVRAEIERMAATYEDPAQVLSWFYSEPSRLRPVESRLVERQAIRDDARPGEGRGRAVGV